jgi:hypothetical protein
MVRVTHISLPTQLLRTRFTRGWTLQELIAPWDVEFFDSAWTSIGHKTNIGNLLSTITGIDEDVLRQQYTLDLVPVAARMSWAARRKTTRPEDMAYCLLGIFNVNLPLLYGEQEKAFQRLQEEIIRSTADLSIFAWWCKKEDNTRDQWALSGVLASSPADFYESGIVKRMHLTDLRDFAFTSVGIRTRLRNLWAAGYGYVLPLNCYSARSGRSLGLRIRKVGREQYLREGPYNLLEYPTGAFEEKRPVERYLLTTLPSLPGVSDRLNRDARFQSAEKLLPLLRLNPVHVKLPQDVEVLEAWPEDRWDDEDRLFFVSGDPRWDSFQLKLRSVIDTKDADGMSVAITFDYVLYALGWSATLGHVMDQTSFGLVSWQQVGNEAEKLLRWAVEEDPSTASLSKRLATVGMPKLQQISFQVPQTLRRLVVAIEGHPKGVDLTIEIIAARDVKAQVPRSWRVFKDY